MSLFKKRVFVIDDDPIFNNLMIAILNKFGLESGSCSASRLLLQTLKKGDPDLIIIDLNIGTAHNGFELIHKIRTEYSPSVPISIASTTTEISAVAHAIELGANDYLFKPLDREVFIAKLMNHLETQELSEMRFEFLPNVQGEFKATLLVDFQIINIDELGVEIFKTSYRQGYGFKNIRPRHHGDHRPR